MSASNYLEAFLAVYGWEMYYLTYLLFAMTGLFLYPLLRAVLEILIEDLSGENNRDMQLRRTLVSAGLMLLVFILALVPMVEISFDKMRVTSPCHDGASVSEANQRSNGQYMINTETRIPVMPYLAMLMGQGFNGVIKNTLPCVLDKTEAMKSVYALDLPDNEEGTATRLQYRRFQRECQAEINRVGREILEGKWDNGLPKGSAGSLSKWFEDELQATIKSTEDWWFAFDSTYKSLYDAYLHSPDSPFVKKMFLETGTSPLLNRQGLPPGLPKAFKAASPVEGFASAGAGGEAEPPVCGDWWNGVGGKGLKQRIIDNLEDQVVLNIAREHGPEACRIMGNTGWGGFGTGNPGGAVASEAQCLSLAREHLAEGKNEKFERLLMQSMMGKHEVDSALSDSQSNVLLASVGASLVSKFIPFMKGFNIAENVLNTAVGFYATIFMLKVMLQFILPFIMMTVYLFWGIYMIIGAMSGRTMFKGMVLIFMLTIVPGIWSIIDHLDDDLYDAMYANNGLGIIKGSFTWVVLDLTTAVFYIGAMFTAFYIVQLAGEGDASGAVKGGQTPNTQNLSTNIGKTAGSQASGGYRGIGDWRKEKWDNFKGGVRGWWRGRPK